MDMYIRLTAQIKCFLLTLSSGQIYLSIASCPHRPRQLGLANHANWSREQAKTCTRKGRVGQVSVVCSPLQNVNEHIVEDTHIHVYCSSNVTVVVGTKCLYQ